MGGSIEMGCRGFRVGSGARGTDTFILFVGSITGEHSM